MYKATSKLTVLFGLALLASACSVVNVEKQPYRVLEKEGSYELRQYEPYIVAETLVDAKFDQAGNVAFNRLFNYIDGNNRSTEKIAMTAPVNQQAQPSKGEKIAMTAPVNQQSAGDQWAVRFVMPAEYTMDTIPAPKDERVVIKEMPGRKMAAVRYGGSWSRKLYDRKEQALREFIAEKGLTITGEPTWARYNPPFWPSFMRRNEILMPVE